MPLETTLPSCASASATPRVASVSQTGDTLPREVLAAIDGQHAPAKQDPVGRLLPKLVDLWRFDAGRLLHDEGLVGKVGKMYLAKEIGYRRRIRHRVPATEDRQVVGDDEFRIDAFIAALGTDTQETFVVPSTSDRGLVGAPAYPGGSAPNPFTWIPVIARHTKEHGVIWEVGPGWVSSAAEVAYRMNRRVLFVQPPAADGHLRLHHDPINGKGEHGLDLTQVDLVLVPLPVPTDAWSVTDCIRAWKSGLGMWARPVGEDLEVEHPEFSCDLHTYLQAVVSRLSALSQVVAAGAKLCVTTPMVRGLPRAVEKTIKREFPTWKLIERRYAVEDGGKVHLGNGTPLVGDALTIWETR